MEGLAAYGSDEESEQSGPEEKAAKRPRLAEREKRLLPPEPAGEADPALAKRLAEWRARGYNPTQQIRQNREFANPQILQKIVEYFNIDDVASCYPTHVFDPQAIVARRAKEKKTQPEAEAPR